MLDRHDRIVNERTLLLTRILPGGCGFGICVETGDRCFVPGSVIEAIKLREGDEFDAKVIPNSRYAEGLTTDTPLFCIFAFPFEDEETGDPAVEPPAEREGSHHDEAPSDAECDDIVEYAIEDVTERVVYTALEDIIFPVSTIAVYRWLTGDDATSHAELKHDPYFCRVDYLLRQMHKEGTIASMTYAKRADQIKAGRRFYMIPPTKKTIAEELGWCYD